ncbi:type II toxin-antitoxin system VapB family antitoxin [Sphingomonas sp. QA11]|uniref:type II toxin-antitoxin system VapB family antitoxin n=1 Tax=Sphingomonas sp. QA11 TaxID=2950605 RepID=UPI00234BBD65|nr:type II toxin-antitoxin system VapB family antitoxin [Sphingomonas sp. QA11]WCM29560.1 type II toxin-antitoxin system VapB family antitoxin [Sphingomonas sp. QA11]
MGVQLNIKDEETVRLARELAAEMGESVTQAVRIALQERRARTPPPRRRARVEETMAVVRGLQDHWKPELRDQELSLTHGDLLYNEDGSFK